MKFFITMSILATISLSHANADFVEAAEDDCKIITELKSRELYRRKWASRPDAIGYYANKYNIQVVATGVTPENANRNFDFALVDES